MPFRLLASSACNSFPDPAHGVGCPSGMESSLTQAALEGGGVGLSEQQFFVLRLTLFHQLSDHPSTQRKDAHTCWQGAVASTWCQHAFWPLQRECWGFCYNSISFSMSEKGCMAEVPRQSAFSSLSPPWSISNPGCVPGRQGRDSVSSKALGQGTLTPGAFPRTFVLWSKLW